MVQPDVNIINPVTATNTPTKYGTTVPVNKLNHGLSAIENVLKPMKFLPIFEPKIVLKEPKNTPYVNVYSQPIYRNVAKNPINRIAKIAINNPADTNSTK